MSGRLALVGVVVLWSGAVMAQCPGGTCPTADPATLAGPAHPAVARIASMHQDGTRCYGTGTLIQKDATQGLVLTCAHLFGSGGPRILVTFPDGQSFEGALLAVDRAWDLAVVRTGWPAAQPVAIATQGPKPGEVLASCGYGPSGRYWCNQGRALGYARTGTTATYETLALSGVARDGDSGGPVFNAQGELVAVLWGTDGRTVQGTYCGRIWKFLRQVLGISDGVPGSPGAVPGWPGAVPGSPGPVRGPWVQGDQPATVPGGPSSPPYFEAWAAEVARLRDRLDAHERLSDQRMAQIEQMLGLTGQLQSRLEKAEAAVAKESLRATIREVLSTVAVEHGPRLIETALPAVLHALGWTGPPSVAVMLAARALVGAARRRAGRRQGVRPRAQSPAPGLNSSGP